MHGGRLTNREDENTDTDNLELTITDYTKGTVQGHENMLSSFEQALLKAYGQKEKWSGHHETEEQIKEAALTPAPPSPLSSNRQLRESLVQRS